MACCWVRCQHGLSTTMGPGPRVRRRLLVCAGCGVVAASARQADGNDLEPGNALEMPGIRGTDAPAGRDRGGGDEAIMGAYVRAGRGQFRPEPGVGPGSKQVEGQGREGGEYRLDERRPVIAAMATSPSAPS